MVKIEIEDKDIATIEALHDVLIDRDMHKNARCLVEARALVKRMYEVLYPSEPKFCICSFPVPIMDIFCTSETSTCATCNRIVKK